MNSVSKSRTWGPRLACFLAIVLLVGCASPRTRRLTDEKYPRRPSLYPIEIFVGELDVPNRKIAIIESRAYENDDDSTRELQLEQLKKKARLYGADAVEDVRILAKRASGFTLDERAPGPMVRQDDFPLFFMRGTAVIYESSLKNIAAPNLGARGETPATEPKSDEPESVLPPL